MLRIAICDDMQDYLRHTKELVNNWQHPYGPFSVDLFSDGDALLTAHNTSPFDIILLDVVMPLLNGIDTARELREKDKTVKIVFLTGSAEFAVDSYTVKASNYLMKPLIPEKLYQCLDEIAQDIRQNAKYILVKGRSAVHRILISSIEYVESDNKFVLFVLTDGQTIASPDPLYYFENKLVLNNGFFKCSRSYIVNIHHNNSFTPKEVRMNSNCRIPISRSCQKEFEAAYFSTLFGKAGEL